MAERTDNPSYPIMTINMNGKSDSKGTAERRRNFLSRIFKLYPSAIVFCQETCLGFENLMPVPENFEVVKTEKEEEKEAAVIWSTIHFDGSQVGLKTTDTQIKEIHTAMCKENKDASDLLSRIAMVKLTPRQESTKESTKSTLAVSFHGQYKAFTKEKRKSVFLSLLKFLHTVIIEEELDIGSYIIGGDFNFDTRTITEIPKLREIPNLRENVVVGEYELSPWSENKKGIPFKDNFVYYRKPILNVSSIIAIDLHSIDTKESVVKAIDLNSKNTKESVIEAIDSNRIDTKESVIQAIDLNSTNTKESVIKAIDLNKDTEESKLLDHDPIVGKLHFTPQTEEGSPSEENPPSEVKNLSKHVKRLNLFKRFQKS